MATKTATLVTPASEPATSAWKIDATHTAVEFSIRHMFTNFKGVFKSVEGRIVRDERDLTRSRIEARVPVASIDTGLADRDAHLRSPDFFDAANHPDLLFRSTRIEPLGGKRYRLVGDLTMRGVTRQVAFEMTYHGEGKDPWGNVRAGATAEAVVSRKEFGLEWNALLETGGLLMGDEVRISLQIEAVQEG